MLFFGGKPMGLVNYGLSNDYVFSSCCQLCGKDHGRNTIGCPNLVVNVAAPTILPWIFPCQTCGRNHGPNTMGCPNLVVNVAAPVWPPLASGAHSPVVSSDNSRLDALQGILEKLGKELDRAKVSLGHVREVMECVQAELANLRGDLSKLQPDSAQLNARLLKEIEQLQTDKSNLVGIIKLLSLPRPYGASFGAN